MNSRRDFLKTSLVATGSMLAGGMAHASTDAPFPGILYTATNPGKWAKKIKTHAPEVAVDGGKVTVTTNHSMSEKHYIVRHTLVSAEGEVLGAKTFTPTDEEPVSTHELPAGYSGKLYATSFCNKHDFWLTELSV